VSVVGAVEGCDAVAGAQAAGSEDARVEARVAGAQLLRDAFEVAADE
jgi:hypothetical protein